MMTVSRDIIAKWHRDQLAELERYRDAAKEAKDGDPSIPQFLSAAGVIRHLVRANRKLQREKKAFAAAAFPGCTLSHLDVETGASLIRARRDLQNAADRNMYGINLGGILPPYL